MNNDSFPVHQVICPGCIILDFKIGSIEGNPTEWTANGCLKAQIPGGTLTSTWWISSKRVQGERQWFVRKQEHTIPISSDRTLDEGLKRYIQTHVDKYTTLHPQEIVWKKPVGPNTAHGNDSNGSNGTSSTDFPADWARRKNDWPNFTRPKPSEPKRPAPVSKPSEAEQWRPPEPEPWKREAEIDSEPKLFILPPPEEVQPEVVKPAVKIRPKLKPEPYNGPLEPYKDKCVCAELFDSKERRPFDWQKRTGGAFARDCFECSCGTRWWRNRREEHFWIEVPDDRLWGNLTRNNGVPTMNLGYVANSAYSMESIYKMRLDRLDYVEHRE